MTGIPSRVASALSRRGVLSGAFGAALGTALPAAAESMLSDSAQAQGAPEHGAGGHTMSTVTTKDGVEIFYKDWGQGQPIVFHHGWPLSSDDWDTQMLPSCRRSWKWRSSISSS